jgi:hypothetical protein
MTRCPICPCDEIHPCPGMIGQRPDGMSHVCDLSASHGDAYREMIRLHGAGMSLPTIEESEAIMAQAEVSLMVNPGGCCG